MENKKKSLIPKAALIKAWFIWGDISPDVL